MLKILKLGGLLFLLVFLVLFSSFSLTDWREYLLSLVYPETISPEQLRAKYTSGPITILLVPGHDKEFRGAAWGGVREEELNLRLARELFNFLSADNHFAIFTAREFSTGEYSPSLTSYFTERRSEVETFTRNLRESFLAFIQSGELRRQDNPPHHNFARPEVALRLFGINKWANDQDIDIVLHIHFNDDPARRLRQPGRYSGFSVYIPERQYPNARASAALGQVLYNTLSRHFPVSDLRQESQGIIEDQDLIAVGSRASRTGASVLAEYAYIYEPQIVSPSISQPVVLEMAWQTYLGIKKYFEPAWPDSTVLLPHRFERHLSEGLRADRDVLVLQRLLQDEQLYPPAGKSNNSCPLNGNFGPCVKAAVVGFQQQYALPPTGYVGELTLEKLNERTNSL